MRTFTALAIYWQTMKTKKRWTNNPSAKCSRRLFMCICQVLLEPNRILDHSAQIVLRIFLFLLELSKWFCALIRFDSQKYTLDNQDYWIWKCVCVYVFVCALRMLDDDNKRNESRKNRIFRCDETNATIQLIQIKFPLNLLFSWRCWEYMRNAVPPSLLRCVLHTLATSPNSFSQSSRIYEHKTRETHWSWSSNIVSIC